MRANGTGEYGGYAMSRANYLPYQPNTPQYWKRCGECGQRMRNLGPRHKRCKDCKRRANAPKPIPPRVPVEPQIKNFYVYGWYRPGEQLPFYIGKGHNSRAWRKHDLEGDVEVRIYRHDLTEEGAFLVEDVLIVTFVGLGAKLLNKRRSRVRQEKPPLILGPPLENGY